MPWELRITRQAEKQIAELTRREREAILNAIDRLVEDPGNADIAKLGGNEWRLRVGRWRVRFEMDNRAGVLWILRVLPRKEAYRR